MNMRKIIALLAAVLMLCAIVPFSAISVAAAAGDVAFSKDFNDGTNGGFDRSYNEDGYIVFDATTADWQCTYQYIGGIKANTMYKVTFKAKANKDCEMNFKINNNWAGDTVKEVVEVTTEWQDYELIINSGDVSAPYVMFSSGYTAANAPIYYIDDLKIVETVDPALIGKVINGDFSDNSGWKLGNGASIADGMLTLTNVGAWSEAAMQTVPVKANTNYEITWKSQCVAGSGVTYMTLMDASFANYQVTSGQIWMTDTSGNWVNHTVTLNTGDHESIIFKLTSESGGTKTINIDDVKITEIKNPSFDGFLYNGDFETGKLSFGTNQTDNTGAWINLWGSNTVELVAGKDSDYALKYTGNNWTQVYQPIAVEPDTNYIVTAWAKDATNSALWAKNAGGSGDITSQNFAAGSDWQLNVMTFNSGTNSKVWIGLMSLATGGTATVDNIKVAKAVPASNDGYIVNGNFEAGSLNSWSLIWDTQVAGSVVDDGHDSAFGAKVTGKAPWGQMRQMITVEANTNYKVTLWAKNVNSMALLIKDGGDSTNIVNAGINAGEEWTEITTEFNSGDNTSVYVGVMVNEATSYGTFDDIKVEKLAPAHTCEYVEEITKAPTCTEDGVKTFTCECGESYTETIPAAHTYDNDCDGECNACNDFSGYRNAPHNLTTYTEAVIPANCKEEGHPAYWTCADCGALCKNADGTGTLNPGWMFYKGECVRPEGTKACEAVACTLCGEMTYGEPCDRGGAPECTDTNCVVCGEIIYGWGHNYAEGFLCCPGTCEYCGESFEYIYEHENGSWAPCAYDGECGYGCGKTYPATGEHIFEDGVTACVGGTCQLCGNDIEGTGHTSDADSACVAGKCVDCGADVAATGEHQYLYACDTHCINCGEKTNPKAKHTIVHVEAKPAVSCVEYGNKEHWYCSDCNAAWLDANLLRFTSRKDVIIAGECIPSGPICQESQCQNCDLTVIPDVSCSFTNACTEYCVYGCGTANPDYVAGHAYAEGVCSICGAIDPDYVAHVCQFVGVETKAPSCTEDGVMTYSCECGEGTYTEAIPALGHTAGAAADCTNAQTCTVCGAELAAALGHSYNAVVTAPDCVNGGYTTYTCGVCGDTYTDDEVAALGHKYDAVVTAPTCVDKGYTTYTCACGDTYVGDEVAALGHNYEAGETVAPDCVNDGYTVYTCACGDTYNGDIIAATGHEYFYPCDPVCMICYEVTNPDAKHNIVAVEAKAATCTATGNIAYWYCSDCGGCWDNENATGMPLNRFSVTIPMVDHEYFYPCDPVCMNCYEVTNPDAKHNIVAVEAKDATCTENGNIAYWYCSDCGAAWADEALTLVTNLRSVVTIATGHSYTNAHDISCNGCGAERTLVLTEDEIILVGGNSVTEEDKTGAGLGFKFETAVDGITFKYAYGYYADYSNAKITIEGVDYKLVEMGAIVNNKGLSNQTLADVEADTDGQILKIKAAKVFADIDGTINYAIRITNIPTENLDTVIISRSYYTYEKDGQLITIYGDDVAESYNSVKSK